MYLLRPTIAFEKEYKKLTKHNKLIGTKIKKAFLLLEEYPAHPSLKTHKVNTPHHSVAFSSRVTGDIRIIWNYDEEERLVIILLDIGGHSGSHKVYK